METKKNTPKTQNLTIGRRILRLIWKAIPICVVLLLIILVILPLGKKISAKKAEMAEKKAQQTATEKPPTNVISMELIPSLLMEKISLPGIAEPWISLNIVSETRGKVVKKNIIEGRYVKKGDVLAILDKSDYKNAYDSALASYETALSTETRLKALVKNDFVTQSQLDDAIGRVKTSKAAFENAKLNLSRCTILSPMQGVINKVHIELGSYLNPGDPVVQILQIDKLKIVVGIPESDVDAVRKLKSFNMKIDALNDRAYTGFHHYLYKTTDSMARLYNLEIRVDNPDGKILPGMFARVDIVKNNDSQGLAVPIYSLINQNEDVGVFVENDGIVGFRPVKTGFQDGWKIQIPEGLYPGEKIVVVGHRIIEDGETVNVTRTIKNMEEITQ